MKRLITAAIMALAVSQAHADYRAKDLAEYCSHVHDKTGDYHIGIAQGVCVGYIAAFAAQHQGWFGHLDVVEAADEFAVFGQSAAVQDLQADVALYVMIERNRTTSQGQ